MVLDTAGEGQKVELKALPSTDISPHRAFGFFLPATADVILLGIFSQNDDRLDSWRFRNEKLLHSQTKKCMSTWIGFLTPPQLLPFGGGGRY